MQAWLAFWMDGKIRRSKTFSSKVHGFELARSMAIDFLKEKRKELGQSSPECDEPAIQPPLPDRPFTRAKSMSTIAPSSTRSSPSSSPMSTIEQGKPVQ